MRRFITTLDELTSRPPRHLVLLYSGGLDGTYLLHLLKNTTVRTTALNVHIGPPDPASKARGLAARFGAAYQEVDVTEEFFTESVPAAIHADAYYQGQFPVGSTLSRPLMARAAVRVARDVGGDAVGHTATYMQNSTARLGRSVVALDPTLHIVAPFLGSNVSRAAKQARLAESGVHLPDAVHSIDVNPWGRVIENGSLESPANRLDESVFTLTRHAHDCPAEPAELTLTFAAGLPVAVDGATLPLGDLVSGLNELGGRHGVGRYSGLEDTAFGVKNHEVRESPAATVITTAHRALANAVLDPREHSLRTLLSTEWTTTVVQGGWFSHLGRSLRRCLRDLDEPLTGTVDLRLYRGAVTVLRLRTPHGLDYARLGVDFHDWMDDYGFATWQRLMTFADTVRTAVDGESPDRRDVDEQPDPEA
ncbi:argininosuccinate synthase domain-containing protein [Micromonospora sp. NBC_01813]|uniref:argininosuccinate synthase domain-containing protein n=1 Tax=Micromonospora sp. NBC_01813 TaxID=2975988 RepID=UPI002DD88890|nr:argininosuccinate synthase domain-containing protein [Micromonospora sp. NBC_01813]WSA10753.1 argininosuccinate synthase [Micromonospora sp. NBC_01813]